MEIRQQLMDHSKRVAWLDENARLCSARLDKKSHGVPLLAMPRSRFFCGILKRAHHGRPHGEDWPGVAARPADRGGRGIGNFVALRMNSMLLDLLFVNGLEGAEADVQ